MATPDEIRRLAGWYTAFATEEARGNSPIYERLALGVAATPELLDFLLTLPPSRRQPNLFLAAARHLHGVPEDVAGLTRIVGDDGESLRTLMLTRTTQTNEPGRCAVLLPLLARLRPPLALIEVGASAGLCLWPDRYGYDYGARKIAAGSGRAAPVFPCRISGGVRLPAGVPQIVWRRGLDLNPIDLRSDDEVAWLETLVWPGREDRARRLRDAIALVRAEPPIVVKGNLLADLDVLIDEAPRDATLVVFHSAVLPYVTPREHREQFAQRMLRSRAIWISNETPNALVTLAHPAPPARDRSGVQFLVMQDGVPFAWAGPHGQSLDWFGPAN